MSTDDIWSEIDAIYRIEERQKDDIDCKQLMKRYGTSQTSALRMMHELVDSKEYEFVTVKDNTTPNKKRLIIRKVSTA